MKLTKEQFQKLYIEEKRKIGSFRLKNFLYEFNLKERKCECCGITKWNGLPAPLELHHKDGENENNQLDNLQILCSNCHALTENFRASNKTNKNTKKRVSIPEEKFKDAIQQSVNPRQVCILLGLAPYGGNYDRVRRIQNKYNLSYREIFKEELDPTTQESKILDGSMKYFRKQPRKKITKYQSREEANIAIRKVKDRPIREDLLKLVWEKSVAKLAADYGITDNGIRKWAKLYKIPVPPIGYWRKYAVGKIDECQRIKSELFEQFVIQTGA